MTATDFIPGYSMYRWSRITRTADDTYCPRVSRSGTHGAILRHLHARIECFVPAGVGAEDQRTRQVGQKREGVDRVDHSGVRAGETSQSKNSCLLFLLGESEISPPPQKHAALAGAGDSSRKHPACRSNLVRSFSYRTRC